MVDAYIYSILKSRCAVAMTFNVKVQDHILFCMTDYVANSKQCYDEPRHTLPH